MPCRSAPARLWPDRPRALLRPAQQSGIGDGDRFYQFGREALLKLSGLEPAPPLPTFKVPRLSSLKKAPGSTEFQRAILQCDEHGAWSVRVTGEQGSGILRSMAEANCFIILPEAQGSVTAGTLVEVQVMEGVI